MLYLGCHLWMKLLKLSIQSIILLYQLLVREHRKKSRLRSAATRPLLGLAFSHDYVSKNSSAFTCQTLHKRCWLFLPTTTNQLEWKHQNLFCIKEKHSQLHHNPFGFPEALKSYVHPASHHLMPGGGRSHKHQRFMAALPGCSPNRESFHSLGNGVSTFSWLAPSAPQVWGGPTPPHSTAHKVSLHTQSFFILYSVGKLY